MSAARASLALGAAALLAACAGAGAEAGTGAGDVREAAVEAAVEARGPGPETISLLDQPLYAPPVPEADRASLEARLTETHAAHLARPDDVEALIVHARVLGQAGRFREAVAVFSDGLRMHPDDAHLYRFRGHRFITLRQFDLAVEDLTRASQLVFWQPDEVEPGLKPNARGIDLDTLQENIWYHLALAHYLQGNYARAYAAQVECMKVSTNDDSIVATSDWMWMTLMRLNRKADAAKVLGRITPSMDILENQAYHRRLLMYKGLEKPEALLDTSNPDPTQIATQGYGVANYYVVTGDTARARQVFDRILAGTGWNAFGYIAAEADVQRLK